MTVNDSNIALPSSEPNTGKLFFGPARLFIRGLNAADQFK
jgi:hypothetical protein